MNHKLTRLWTEIGVFYFIFFVYNLVEVVNVNELFPFQSDCWDTDWFTICRRRILHVCLKKSRTVICKNSACFWSPDVKRWVSLTCVKFYKLVCGDHLCVSSSAILYNKFDRCVSQCSLILSVSWNVTGSLKTKTVLLTLKVREGVRKHLESKSNLFSSLTL